MQKKFGFSPLGGPRSAVKTAIFGDNNARLYGIQPARVARLLNNDRIAALKVEYEADGAEPSNVRYGYVRRV
jgi:uncharacterized protein